MTIDIAALRALVNSEPKTSDYCVRCGSSPDAGEHLPHGHDYVDPRHIAAFSPSVVLELLDRVEAAERDLSELREATGVTRWADDVRLAAKFAKERDDAKEERDTESRRADLLLRDADGGRAKRDAAIARAESAERERDDWHSHALAYKNTADLWIDKSKGDEDERCALQTKLSAAESLLDTLEQERVELATQLGEWQNAAICVECGRCKVDEDGCCATCGLDALLFADGRLVNGDWLDNHDADVRNGAERSTAEQIAAWLRSSDASDAWCSDTAYGEDQHEAWLADRVRSFAWKAKP